MSKFVVLMWSEYHQLMGGSSSKSFDSKEQANNYTTSYLDHIVEVPGKVEADELIKSFNQLCAADWTPNQDSKDREENSLIANEAKKIIWKYSQDTIMK